MMVMHSDSIAMAVVHCVVLCSLVTLTAQTPMQVVVPQGIESVNGSAVNMGCTSPLVDSDGVMICDECSTNLLIDGNSPVIDTSTSDWASQLVTVRKTQTDEIPFEHVLLTFGFDTAVTLTVIEMDLFLCPEWGINAQFISVYANVESNLVVTSNSLNNLLFTHYTPSQSSCGSLSTVAISLGDALTSSSYLTWHILFSSFPPSIDWVHVGEVRFLGLGNTPQVICPTPTVTSFESMTPVTSFASSVTISTPPPTTSTSSVSSTPDLVSSSPQASPSSSRVAIPAPPSSLVSSAPAVSSSHVSTPTQATSSSLPVFSSTPTHPPVSSTSPTTIMPSPSYNSRSSISETLLILTAVGVVLLVVIVTVSIIICIWRKCPLSRKTTSYELQKLSTPQYDTEDHSISATNPMDNSRYACTDPSIADTDSADSHYDFIRKEMITSPIIEAFYDKVARDQPSTVVDAGYQIIALPVVPDQPPTAAGYELISLPVVPDQPPTAAGYELIPLPGDTTRAPETAPSIPQHPPNDAQPGSPAEMSDRSYSVVQIRRGPKIPEKSSDLVQYLETCAPFNENIYSESITPSDFMSSSNQPSDTEDVPGDPVIYAPIYPSPSVVPESPERPAEVTIDNMTEKRPLRTGQFGEVVLAATRGLSLKDLHLSRKEDDHDVSITVAVKKLKPNPTQTQREAFEREGKFLSRLRHPNVVRLLGVCYQDPAFIMMEYMREGDLSQFLQKYSEVVSMTTPSSETQIARSTLVYMASQIASGMKQLTAFNFVHRDLATRNCLVGKNFTVKVASLGVDKNVSQSHYFKIQGNTLLPIRWMAPECFNGIFSEKSDVWAFGVTMWELFTLAKKPPYSHLSDEEVIHNALKREHRQSPSQPTACPDHVYETMEKCWTADMTQRTTFKNLYTILQSNS